MKSGMAISHSSSFVYLECPAARVTSGLSPIHEVTWFQHCQRQVVGTFKHPLQSGAYVQSCFPFSLPSMADDWGPCALAGHSTAPAILQFLSKLHAARHTLGPRALA